MNYAEIIQKLSIWLIVFTLTKQLSPFNLVPQHCFHCPLLLALHTRIYVVQFSRCDPSGFLRPDRNARTFAQALPSALNWGPRKSDSSAFVGKGRRNLRMCSFRRQAEAERSRFLLTWWAKVDSNHRPHDYQSCALTS